MTTNENIRRLGLAVLVVAIFGAAGWMFFHQRERTRKIPGTFNISGVCLNCKTSGEFTYKAGERQPLVCPKCGQRAVYQWFYCPKCRMRLVPPLEPDPAGGPPRLPLMARCPKCGTPIVQWIPEDPDQKPIGDMPLPEWKP